MAQITYRVSGTRDGKRVTERFRNTDEGRQAAKEYAGRLDDSRTVYDVRTRIDGRVVTKTFKRRRDADSYGTMLEAKRLQGLAVDPRRARITLREYSQSWLAGRSHLAERTAELYRWLLDQHILPDFGAVALGDVSRSAVHNWNAKLADAHPNTAAKAYRLLSSIMRSAIAD